VGVAVLLFSTTGVGQVLYQVRYASAFGFARNRFAKPIKPSRPSQPNCYYHFSVSWKGVTSKVGLVVFSLVETRLSV